MRCDQINPAPNYLSYHSIVWSNSPPDWILDHHPPLLPEIVDLCNLRDQLLDQSRRLSRESAPRSTPTNGGSSHAGITATNAAWVADATSAGRDVTALALALQNEALEHAGRAMERDGRASAAAGKAEGRSVWLVLLIPVAGFLGALLGCVAVLVLAG